MFHTDRWARAFLAVSGENSAETFQYIKIFSSQVKRIHGAFFGHSAASELEKVLLESVNTAGITEESNAALYAVRFVCLLVERNRFKYIDLLTARIEQILNARNGILDVTLESASPVDSVFETELSQMIKERTGAVEVKMKTKIREDLLGGFLLRIGSFYIDASLKGQINKLASELNRTVMSANSSVVNGGV